MMFPFRVNPPCCHGNMCVCGGRGGAMPVELRVAVVMGRASHTQQRITATTCSHIHRVAGWNNDLPISLVRLIINKSRSTLPSTTSLIKWFQMIHSFLSLHVASSIMKTRINLFLIEIPKICTEMSPAASFSSKSSQAVEAGDEWSIKHE